MEMLRGAMAGVFLLKEGTRNSLLDDRTKLEREVAVLLSNLQNTRGTAGSRTEVQRLLDIARSRLGHVSHVLNNHTIIEPATHASIVGIGTIITIQRLDEEDRPIAMPETYAVEDYGSTDPKSSPARLSYDCQLIRSLMGLPVDEKRDPAEVKLGNRPAFYVKLLSISLPSRTTQSGAA